MGVPTLEVGYTPAMPRREDHEVHKRYVVALEKIKHYHYTIDTHYRNIPLHFSHNERTPVQISLQYLHWC